MAVEGSLGRAAVGFGTGFRHDTSRLGLCVRDDPGRLGRRVGDAVGTLRLGTCQNLLDPRSETFQRRPVLRVVSATVRLGRGVTDQVAFPGTSAEPEQHRPHDKHGQPGRRASTGAERPPRVRGRPAGPWAARPASRTVAASGRAGSLRSRCETVDGSTGIGRYRDDPVCGLVDQRIDGGGFRSWRKYARLRGIMVDVLGLGGDESAAYRALVGVPSADADDLAALLEVARDNAYVLLMGLETAGLAVRSLGDRERFVATPPSTALRGTLLHHKHELLRAEAELSALDEIYKAATVRQGVAGVVDVVRGSAAVREMFGRLQLGARDEVLSMVKAPVAVISAAENSAEDTAVARGVRYRVLVERAMLTAESGTLQQIADASAAGEQVRLAAALPLKLIIVDREQALLPLRTERLPGALLVHESGLLSALVALFDAEWARAVPAVAEAPEVDALDIQIVGLLLTGLTDEAVAAHLSTSLRTVQRRVHRLMELTGGRTRIQLGFEVAKRGWLTPRG